MRLATNAIATATVILCLASEQQCRANGLSQQEIVNFFVGRADHWLCLEKTCISALPVAKFAIDSAIISRDEIVQFESVLAAVADVSLASYKQSYQVSCFTDQVGAKDYNLALSAQRAGALEAVARKSKMAANITYVGKGVYPESDRPFSNQRVCEIEVIHTLSRFRD